MPRTIIYIAPAIDTVQSSSDSSSQADSLGWVPDELNPHNGEVRTPLHFSTSEEESVSPEARAVPSDVLSSTTSEPVAQNMVNVEVNQQAASSTSMPLVGRANPPRRRRTNRHVVSAENEAREAAALLRGMMRGRDLARIHRSQSSVGWSAATMLVCVCVAAVLFSVCLVFYVMSQKSCRAVLFDSF